MSDRTAEPTVTDVVHALAATLPRHRHPFSRRDIPANGVYLLFESGETVTTGDGLVERIVRVGTHTGEGRLGRRLAIHYSGDRRRSVFRLHVGAALLARDDPAAPRLAEWTGAKQTPMPEVEEVVTGYLRERFTFCCIPVPDKDERLALEQAVIALLAQYPPGPPSDGWLGLHAPRPEIRRSGLWNTQHLAGVPLDAAGFARIETLAAAGR